MTHLLALREREPAPMAVIALRIEGLSGVAASLGRESANVLRRKVAVRLRASLRASDVVASIGNDAFVVLLAWIDSPADGERVAGKLVPRPRALPRSRQDCRCPAAPRGRAGGRHGRDGPRGIRPPRRARGRRGRQRRGLSGLSRATRLAASREGRSPASRHGSGFAGP
jgi:GGDEF domain-containing protein